MPVAMDRRVARISMIVRSPAKINWTLRVLGRRSDAFHEIESLVSVISLCDEIEFTAGRGSGFELVCEDSELPLDDRNLIVRAAKMLAARSGLAPSTRCRLVKRIPVGGGLGGGSSNAATTLMALNRLWRLDWPKERLLPLAAELGSDVPFFLQGGWAVIAGRGEQVRPVRADWSGWIVLLLPAEAVSTAQVYAAWRPEPDGDRGLPVMPGGGGAEDWMQQTFNMLEEAAMSVCPPLRALQEQAGAIAGRPVRLSGSGSSLFTAFDHRSEAEVFSQRSRQIPGVQTCVVQPLTGCSDYHSGLQQVET